MDTALVCAHVFPPSGGIVRFISLRVPLKVSRFVDAGTAVAALRLAVRDVERHVGGRRNGENRSFFVTVDPELWLDVSNDRTSLRRSGLLLPTAELTPDLVAMWLDVDSINVEPVDRHWQKHAGRKPDIELGLWNVAHFPQHSSR